MNVQANPVREYVSKRVGAHLLGTVDIYADEYAVLRKGLSDERYSRQSGIEAALESELRGINGISTITKDSSGTIIDKSETTPRSGQHGGFDHGLQPSEKGAGRAQQNHYGASQPSESHRQRARCAAARLSCLTSKPEGFSSRQAGSILTFPPITRTTASWSRMNTSLFQPRPFGTFPAWLDI